MSSLEERVKAEAIRLGFALCGIARATEADNFERYLAWLDKGYHGAMEYLVKKARHRRHPRHILESVRSVIVVALEDSVSRDREYSERSESPAPRSAPKTPRRG